MDTSRWERLHRAWLARTLRMRDNGNGAGIDLLDGVWDTAIELKSRYAHNPSQSYTVNPHKDYPYEQEHPGMEMLFCFLRYDVAGSPKYLKKIEANEENITMRECFLVPYAWVRQFPIYRGPGETNYLYVYQGVIEALPLDDFVSRELDDEKPGLLYVMKGTRFAQTLDERLEMPF